MLRFTGSQRVGHDGATDLNLNLNDQPRQHIRKQRHYLPSKVLLVKAMVFPVVMCGCESWTLKKAKRQRIDAFLFFLILFYF